MSSSLTPLTPSAHPKPLLGVSLKMYFSLAQTTNYINSLPSLALLSTTLSIDLFLIPDPISLTTASALLRAHAPTIALGAPNCFYEDAGPYTGEISPAVLAQVGCSIVELGHAERRKLFGETDEMVARKARAVVRNGMTPLVCVGEESEGGGGVRDAVEECTPQVQAVLQATEGTAGEVVFAYEPVWAIGKEEPASAAYVVGVVKGLRRLCEGRRVRFLYGGSAGPGTFEAMREAVDGLFLGRFAHDPKRLEEVVREVGRYSRRGRTDDGGSS